ncbi:type VI secretion system spike protein VgrG1b [soil metagenome]
MPTELTVTLTIKPFKSGDVEDEFVFKSLRWQEELGRLPVGHLEFLGAKVDSNPERMLGRLAVIGLLKPNGERRFFTGDITRVTFVGEDRDAFLYRAVLRPSAWRLTLSKSFTIFQDKSVKEILENMLAVAKISANLFLTSDYDARKREHCTMYRESIFNFISRLMEEEGIYYMFDHSESGQSMFIVDDIANLSEEKGDELILAFAPAGRSMRDSPFAQLFEWTAENSSVEKRVRLFDYNYLTPAVDLDADIFMVPDDDEHLRLGFSEFDYPGRARTPHEIDVYGHRRSQEITAGSKIFRGRTNARHLRAGFNVVMGNPAVENLEVLVTSANIEFSIDASGTGDNQFAYDCSFTAIPKGKAFSPRSITPKPIIHGPQTAVVVGGKDEEIHTDALGRVKVLFFWDFIRRKKGKTAGLETPEDLSSCFIRVAQPWAGKGFGAVHVPRIGHEVIVEFLDGDPDRPIITGSVYHKDNPPPWVIKEHQTRTGIVTRSSLKGTAANANSFVFEDKKGAEFVALHAELNLNISVEADENHTVGHDRTRKIGHDEKVEVVNNRDKKIGVDESSTIGANRTESVGSNEDITIGANRTETVGTNESVTIGVNRSHTIGTNDDHTVGANHTQAVGGNQSMSIGGNRADKVGGNVDLSFGANLNQIVGANVDITAGGKMTLTATGGYTLVAPAGTKIIDWQFEGIGNTEMKTFHVNIEAYTLHNETSAIATAQKGVAVEHVTLKTTTVQAKIRKAMILMTASDSAAIAKAGVALQKANLFLIS